MRQSSLIRLKRAIVHLVSPTESKPILSQRALPANRMGELHDFFAGHIENSLQDEDSRTARFVKDADDPVVHDALPAVFGSSQQFTTATKRVALHLHSVVTLDKRISAGALVCCSYSAKTPRLKDTEFLALLKLDPTEGYQPKETEDSQGRKYVTLSPLDNVVPTTRERLQKCAFIRTRQAKMKYDMLVLDRQGRARDAIAAFFIEKFLKAALVADSVSNTNNFWLGAWKCLGDIEAVIGPRKAGQVRKAMQVAMHSPRIDIDKWVVTLPLTKQYQDQMLSALVARLDDRTIETDADVADRLTQRAIYKGERGFRLAYERLYEDEILKSPPKLVNDPKYGKVFELTLRVKGLEQVRS